MANLVLVTTAKSVKVEFNDLAGDYSKGTWALDQIASIRQYGTYVEIIMKNDQRWLCSYDATKMQIDTIDTVAPTSNADLYTKLIAIIE